MKILSFLPLVFLLSSCDSKQGTTPAPTSPSAPASDSVSAPASAPSVEAGQTASAPTGMNPTFQIVASHLDVSGGTLSFSENKTDNSMLGFFDQILAEAAKNGEIPDMPKNFSFSKIMDMLGLNCVTAYGSSSMEVSDGFRIKSFQRIPKKPLGLYTILNGRGAESLANTIIPKGMDAVIEFDLKLSELHSVLDEMKGLLPEAEQEKFMEKLDEPVLPDGSTIRKIMEQTDAHIALFAKLLPDQEGPDGMPAFELGLAVDGLGWMLTQQIEQMKEQAASDAPFEVTEEDGLVKITAKEPMGPPPFDKPSLQYDPKTDRLLLGSTPGMMAAILAPDNKLKDDADWKKATEGLTVSGHLHIFASTAFQNSLKTVIQKAAEGNGSGKDSEMIVKVLDRILGVNAAAVSVAYNKDGMLLNGKSPINTDMGLSSVTTVAIMAAFAVPAVTASINRAKSVKSVSNARQILIALHTYAADNNGDFPEKLDKLDAEDYIPLDMVPFVNPDTGKQEEWIYNSGLNSSDPGSWIVIASPPIESSGKRVVGHIEGSCVLVSEEEFKREVELMRKERSER